MACQERDTHLLTARSTNWSAFLNISIENIAQWKRLDQLRVAAELSSGSGTKKRYATDSLNFMEDLYQPVQQALVFPYTDSDCMLIARAVRNLHLPAVVCTALRVHPPVGCTRGSKHI